MGSKEWTSLKDQNYANTCTIACIKWLIKFIILYLQQQLKEIGLRQPFAVLGTPIGLLTTITISFLTHLPKLNQDIYDQTLQSVVGICDLNHTSSIAVKWVRIPHLLAWQIQHQQWQSDQTATDLLVCSTIVDVIDGLLEAFICWGQMLKCEGWFLNMLGSQIICRASYTSKCKSDKWYKNIYWGVHVRVWKNHTEPLNTMVYVRC